MADAAQADVKDWFAELNRLLAGLPNRIEQIDMFVAVLLVLLGVVSLLYGYRVFRGIVVVYSSVAGAALGYWLVVAGLKRPDLWWIGLIGGGMLLAVLAWPLVNFFVAAWGAVAGGLVGAALTRAVGGEWPIAVAVAIGVILGAILAVLVFRFMIILTTSVLGAAMAVAGLISLLYHVERIRPGLQEYLTQTPYMLPLVMAAPALLGVFYQLWHSQGREAEEDQRAEKE